MNSALAGARLGQVLGQRAARPAEVFRAAQLRKVGGAAAEGALLVGQELACGRRRLAANGGGGQVARGAPAVLTVRARARCGGSGSGGDHELRGRR